MADAPSHPGARRTRLAPSPTGDLHLGNARSFLLNWALARREGWMVLLRHEDLDATRASPETCLDIERSMGWLGLDWDEGPVRQSEDLDAYIDAMRHLGASRRIYRCDLSRREIREAIGAPHAGGEIRFPASLRPTEQDQFAFAGPDAGHRYAMREGAEQVLDELHGTVAFDPADDAGDPVVWTRDGRPGYQLAVVVDDLRHEITDVVRGADLLPSAARQQRIAGDLGAGTPPRWWHLPIVHDAEGRRLAKRDGDGGLLALHDEGVPADRIVGLLLHASGLVSDRKPRPASDAIGLIDRASLRTLVERESARPCRITPEDLAWLRS